MVETDFPEARFFRTLNHAELWQRYCGFLDLSREEFMAIQQYLLLEQIKLVAETPLAKAIMGGSKPSSVEEFRRNVPITSYEDYAPHISDGREDALVEKPHFWCHTAGRGGNFKWIPYTRAAFDRVARYGVAVAMLAAADRREDVRLTPSDRLLVNLAPRPYGSGSLLYHFAEYFPYTPIPPLDAAEDPDFRRRTELAFRLALHQGIDYIFSLSNVLVKIGASFSDQRKRLKFTPDLLAPSVFSRLGLAWLRSKVARRRVLPRDLWGPKGLITFGVDTPIYESELARLWGRVPYQVYGTTEMLISAVQGWNKKGMVFVPDLAFWEFIPEEEWRKAQGNGNHQPATVLMDELEPGKQYELVFTHFHGMPLLRYRIGDVIRVLALEDTNSGVKLPQVMFQARASEIIDLAGLTQVDERTLLQALANAEVKYEDWCARKEYRQGVGYLRLFLELTEPRPAEELERLLEQQLRTMDVDYRDLEGWLEQQRAVAVTLLPRGTFRRFYDEMVSQGATLVHLKPSRINPTQAEVERLLRLAKTADRR